jgi:MraZ protein
MFRGSSFHTIDTKGRIIIPARFREKIAEGGGDGVMVTCMDRALFAYPYNEWSRIEGRILALAEKSTAMRRFRRVFIGGAFDCPCDRQGRVLIPPSLRQYAAIEKEIVIVGVLEYFEIWSRANWEQEHLNLDEDLQQEEVLKEISKLSL